MSSRLDRLFILLESGGSSVTRNAAAQQLGDIVQGQGVEVRPLLQRLLSLLYSKCWDTRIASSAAVGAILNHTFKWTPAKDSCLPEIDVERTQFCLKQILSSGVKLDAGNESAYSAPLGDVTTQKKLVNERLGLDFAETLGIDAANIVTEEDLSVAETKHVPLTVGVKRSKDEDSKCSKFLKVEDADNGEMEDSPEMIHMWLYSEFSSHLFMPEWEKRHGACLGLRELLKHHSPPQQQNEQYQRWLWLVIELLTGVLARDKFGDYVGDQVVAPVRETAAQALGLCCVHLSTPHLLSLMSLLSLLIDWPDCWTVRHGGMLGLKYTLAIRPDARGQLLQATYPAINGGLTDSYDDVVCVAAQCLTLCSTEDVTKSYNGDTPKEEMGDTSIDVTGDSPKEEIGDAPNGETEESADEEDSKMIIDLDRSSLQDSLLGFLSTDQSTELLTRVWSCLQAVDDLTASTPSLLSLLSNLVKNGVTLSHEGYTQRVPHLLPFLYHSCPSVRRSALTALQVLTSPRTNPSSQTNGGDWLHALAPPLLKHLYQRALLEPDEINLDLIYKVWSQMLNNLVLSSLLMSTCHLVSSWIYLVATPSHLPLDTKILLSTAGEKTVTFKPYFGGTFPPNKDVSFTCKTYAAKLLGQLSLYVVQPMEGSSYSTPDEPVKCYVRLLLALIRSQSANQRLSAALIVREWALMLKKEKGSFLSVHHTQSESIAELENSLLGCLYNPVYYDEIAVSFTRLQQDTQNFIATLKHYELTVPETYLEATVLTLDQVASILNGEWLLSQLNGRLRTKVRSILEERRKAILEILQTTNSLQESLSLLSKALIAGTIVRMGKLPEKLNAIVTSLMDAVKFQDIVSVQRNAGKDLSLLIELCNARSKSPNVKIVKNLSSFLCMDATYTPQISQSDTETLDGIYSLRTEEVSNGVKKCVQPVSNGTQKDNTDKRKRGRPPSKPKDIITSEEVACDRPPSIQRRGCVMAMESLVLHFNTSLPATLSSLWALVSDRLKMSEKGVNFSISALMGACHPSSSKPSVIVCPSNGSESEGNKVKELVNWLQLVEVVTPVLSDDLIESICTHLKRLETYLYHKHCAVRHMAARVFGVLAVVRTDKVLLFIIDNLLHSLKDITCVHKRQGAVECLQIVVERLALKMLPYVVLLIVPMLKSSSDSDSPVRTVGCEVFASLIKLLPLDGFMPDPPSLPSHVRKMRDSHREFLSQLVDGKKAHQYHQPVNFEVTLRDYQQTGVNWLAFLRDYGLHGILCDDMGLGKTLQAICILACSHYEYDEKEKKKGEPQCMSLVICPPTLTGHWMAEIEQYSPSEILKPLQYAGVNQDRLQLQSDFKKHNLIVASYDIIRKDVDFLSKHNWLYVILDEGHVIKNTKTKSFQAIKRLVARHRLILSGTPIQNNVIELWALFNFLMPGYLGTEKLFTAKYSRPIIQSRDPKASKSDQEAGVVAMEALHRQTLPFMMRRVKEDVLKELPPKITQDYYCDLSPSQKILYEDFLENQGKDLESENAPKMHVFQALQYLRLVCNHPALVLRPQHPRYKELLARTGLTSHDLNSLSISAKLPALKNLLLECGVGQESSVVSQHRVLIFCQLRAMLDIIEKDLFKKHMPSISFIRLDGSVPTDQRFSLVQSFNRDPSVDVMLLTTQVGGLGLNLTSADTVIFVEHDWNPMKDLQAMDRAHRLGQKKVVSVYRLITRNTLEEKIMGLQKFKLFTANTIISQENASMSSMGTEQVLDMFSLQKKDKKTIEESEKGEAFGGGVGAPRSVLENLPDLWDDSQYHDQYDVDKFLSSISRKTTFRPVDTN